MDKLIGLIDHAGRVSDIDSIKLVQGQLYQLKMTKKFQDIKESKAKMELKEASYILNTLS